MKATHRTLFGLSMLSVGCWVHAAGNFYCCNDANGKQVCGDILPQACIGRAYREVGASGTTLRHIEAPLTPEQRAARTAEEERRKAEEEKRKEQQRKDQALLNTYGSEKDIELMRQRGESDLLMAIKNAESRIADVRAQRKKLESEAEFYKKKPLPQEIDKGLRNADYEIKSQESVIEAKKNELQAVRSKYAEDLRRYLELTRKPQNR